MSAQQDRIRRQINGKWAHAPAPEEWKLRARCRGEDPDLWFPQGDGQRRSDRKVRAVTVVARSFCLKCPVKNDCLSYAITLDLRYGMWGGLTERQRASLTGRRLADG